jgi:hypothetical protein
MSSSAPPLAVHKIQYVYNKEPKSAVPQKFITRLEVCYRRSRILPGVSSILKPKFQLNYDISVRHLLLLEATVDNTKNDHFTVFKFPTQKKTRVHRMLEINYFNREIGEGIPTNESLEDEVKVSLPAQFKNK